MFFFETCIEVYRSNLIFTVIFVWHGCLLCVCCPPESFSEAIGGSKFVILLRLSFVLAKLSRAFFHHNDYRQLTAKLTRGRWKHPTTTSTRILDMSRIEMTLHTEQPPMDYNLLIMFCHPHKPLTSYVTVGRCQSIHYDFRCT